MANTPTQTPTQRTDMVLQIFLEHCLARAQVSTDRINDLIQIHEERFDLTVTEEAGADDLWAIMDVSP